MTAQTSIPVPDAPAHLGPCRWCGKPSVDTIEVEPPKYRNHRGVRVVARVALEVPACKHHMDILGWQPSEKIPE